MPFTRTPGPGIQLQRRSSIAMRCSQDGSLGPQDGFEWIKQGTPTLQTPCNREEVVERPQARADRRRAIAAACGSNAHRSSRTRGRASGESSHSLTVAGGAGGRTTAGSVAGGEGAGRPVRVLPKLGFSADRPIG